MLAFISYFLLIANPLSFSDDTSLLDQLDPSSYHLLAMANIDELDQEVSDGQSRGQESLTLLSGIINPVNGRVCGREVDLEMNGPIPFTFDRYFHDSVNTNLPYHSWVILQYTMGYVCYHDEQYPLKIFADSGELLSYGTGKYNPNCHQKPLKISLDYFKKGYTNSQSGLITATNHKKNHVGLIPNDYEIHLTEADGTIKYFYPHMPKKKLHAKGSPQLLLLKEIKLPSGHFVIYERKVAENKDIQLHIKFTSPSKTKVFSSATLSVKPMKNGNQVQELRNSAGRVVRYHFEKRSGPKKILNKVEGRTGGDHSYIYMDAGCNEYGITDKYRIKTKLYQNGLSYDILHYYSKDKGLPKAFKFDDPKKNFVLDRNVKKAEYILAPIGPNGKKEVMERCVYYSSKHNSSGYTQVYDNHENKTVYHYNKKHRITDVEYFEGRKQFLYSEHFAYDESKKSNTFTNLLYHYTKDENNQVRIAKTFEYDPKGSVTKETTIGNLSGKSINPILLSEDGVPLKSSSESYSKYYTYSDDRFHLKLSEKNDFGVQTAYTYLEGTNLPLSEIISVKGEIKERVFYTYDEDNLLYEKIADDGASTNKEDLTGVSERRIVRYHRNQEGNGIGLAAQVDELYLDIASGKEILLKSKKKFYTSTHYLAKEELYDSEGQFLYDESYEYNEKGDLIQKVDLKGIITHYTYNDMGQKIFESQTDRGSKTYTYDLLGRVVEVVHATPEGASFHTKMKYNLLNHKIEEEDLFGQTFKYEYDRFGRVTKTISPLILDEHQAPATQITMREYDFMGRVKKEIDPKGFATQIEYNMLGKPTLITYCDGTFESFVYDAEGNLVEAVSKCGSRSVCSYDYRGRELLAQMFSKEGRLLKSTLKEYKGWRLVKEIDEAGNITCYEYNGAGRVVAKRVNGILTTFEYDAKGSLYKKISYSENGDFIAHITLTDRLNQLIEERVESENGIKKQIQYSYDRFGNKIEVIESLETPAISSIQYNSLNDPIAYIDPLGNRTELFYDRGYLNSLGQRVMKLEEINPLKVKTITLFDALGRVVSKEVVDAQGIRLKFQEIFYDLSNNQALTIDYVIKKETLDKKVETVFEFGMQNRIERQIKAKGTDKERICTYHYNKNGQLESIIECNSKIMNHEYDEMGRLSRKYSSGSDLDPIDYSYLYGFFDQVIEVVNNLSGRSTKRIYDNLGRLCKEHLENGHELSYSFDDLYRLTKIALPDQSAITYTYDGSFVHKVIRWDKNVYASYFFEYGRRDLSGHILELTTPVGTQHFTWNLLGGLNEVNSPYFYEKVKKLDAIGNLLEVERRDSKTFYEYDSLSQLTHEEGAASHTYLYDSCLNRIQKDEKEWEFDELNEASPSSGDPYTYDLFGNLLSKEDKTYHYDALNRLTKVTLEDGSSIDYTYDAFNRRMKKESGDFVETYLWIHNIEVGAVDETGAFKQLKILGQIKNHDHALAIGLELNGEVFTPIYDIKSTMALIVANKDCSVQESYIVDAFGNQLVDYGDGCNLEAPSLNPWVYLNKRLDLESGFIYFGFRYLDPNLGRWISEDPLGFSEGSNLYHFVQNNPVMNRDLFGLSTINQKFNDISQQMPSSLNNQSTQNKGFFEIIREFIGSMIYRLGHELPIPFIRLGIKAIGYCIEHGNFVMPEISSIDEHSRNGHVTGWLHKDYVIAFVNGIGNTFAEAQESAQKLSKANGGAQVNIVYNGSDGYILDFLECIANAIGAPTEVGNLVEDSLRTFAGIAEKNNQTVVVYAHSQGGLLTKNALKQLNVHERSYFDVKTFGSAANIPNDLAANVVNYVNRLDPIPWIGDWPGMLRALFDNGANVTFVDHPKTAKIFDHMFLAESYSSAWKSECKNYIRGKDQ